jgi:hypothetical protein
VEYIIKLRNKYKKQCQSNTARNSHQQIKISRLFVRERIMLEERSRSGTNSQQVTELTNDEREEKCRLCGRQQIVQFLLSFAFKSLRVRRTTEPSHPGTCHHNWPYTRNT